MSFPLDFQSATVSDSQLPYHAHAAPMPLSDHAVLLKATAQHARRQTACGLPARFRLLPATKRSSTKIVIRSISILLTTTVKSGSSTLQKRRSVNCWTSSSDISGYHSDFHEGHGTVGACQGRGMACVN